jgi:hypothetical protein
MLRRVLPACTCRSCRTLGRTSNVGALSLLNAYVAVLMRSADRFLSGDGGAASEAAFAAFARTVEAQRAA